MPNYQNGKVYKIVSNTDDDICYIGSTTKKYLSQRMSEHRCEYKNWKNGKCNKIMVYDLFETYQIKNCRIELLELVPCNSKDELTKKEGEYIRALNCVNKVIPDRIIDMKEYREQNKDKNKLYREQNKDKIREQTKLYREQNKDKKKLYREQNKDKIREQTKLYYDKNKNIILEKLKQKRASPVWGDAGALYGTRA